MKKERIEHNEICTACNGTGVFQGMGERDGFAVVCFRCGGTGNYHFVHEFEPFVAKGLRINVHTIIEVNPGICVGGTLLRFGGMDYRDWLAGLPFPKGSEMREFVCPTWWYQSADYNKMPKWKECGLPGGTFSSCPRFLNKHLCWDRWDKEQEIEA